VSSIETGDSLCIEIVYSAPDPIDSPIFGVTISSEERNDFLDVNTDASGLRLPRMLGKGSIRLILDRLDLKAGRYYVNPGIYQRNWEYVYDYHWHVYPIIVDSKTYSRGVLTPPHRWVLG
jgi:lipopolysaccharide transport system ATP-binding protein